MDYSQSINYSKLTGIPLALVLRGGPDLAAAQQRQGFSLLAAASSPDTGLPAMQRVQQGLDALVTGTAPAELSPVSSAAPPVQVASSPVPGRALLLVGAGVLAFLLLRRS